MLTARRAPRACLSCRLQLLSLFENGFAGAAMSNRLRYSTQVRIQSHTIRPSRRVSSRQFSTTIRRATDPSKEDFTKEASAKGKSLGEKPLKEESLQEPVEEQLEELGTESLEAIEEDTIESIVVQARQTFGETLPNDYLSPEEYALYERLYGPPIRETRPEDLEYILGEEEEEPAPEKVRNILLTENKNGVFEEVEYDPKLGFRVVEEEPSIVVEPDEVYDNPNEEIPEVEVLLEDGLQQVAEEPLVGHEEIFEFQGKNQRERDAIARLQRDMEAALARQAEEEVGKEEQEEEEQIEEEYEEEEEPEEKDEEDDEFDALWVSSESARTHPHTLTGRYGTDPSTLSLPREEFVAPIAELLERPNMKHLSEAAEKAFGGKGLPFSASTPASKKLLPQHHIGLDAGQHRMSELEADAYMAAVMPGTYAAVMSTLVEVRKRLGTEWLRNLMFREGGQGARVLDAGAGGGGVVAWREIVQAEWDVLREEGIVDGEEAPHGKSTVLTGSNSLRHRVSRFIDNTTFLPRLPDYVHASSSREHLDGSEPQERKAYDVIIASHTLFPLKEDFRRKNVVKNLWSLLDPKGGVLIIIEKGLPRGFEAIAGARSLLLESFISSPGETSVENFIQSPDSEGGRFREKEAGMIIAPCTNHKQCPMYPIPGLSSGRKDYCHFSQRYIRPPFLQRVLGALARNHEDVKFSYLAVCRGVDDRKTKSAFLQGEEATLQSFEGYEEHDLPETEGDSELLGSVKFHPLSLPRAILPPLKRRGHVTLDLCTPSGKLERWTVPRSFSKVAYRDARKSKWGDLWALGAKTRVLRTPRLGRSGSEGQKRKGIRDGKQGKGGKKVRTNEFDVVMGRDGMEGIERSKRQTKYFVPEKRTKGGRVFRKEKAITEDDLG